MRGSGRNAIREMKLRFKRSRDVAGSGERMKEEREKTVTSTGGIGVLCRIA
jgi:hypothetical protein